MATSSNKLNLSTKNYKLELMNPLTNIISLLYKYIWMHELTFLFQTISGRPPPAASMAVGQFFYPEDGQRELSPRLLLRSSYVHEVSIEADSCFYA